MLAAGVIDEAGTVDRNVVEWLTVLSRRDVALMIHVRTPSNGRSLTGARARVIGEQTVGGVVEDVPNPDGRIGDIQSPPR